MAKRHYDLALATNTEAYFPVTLSLIKLRIRKFWHTTILRDHKHGALCYSIVRTYADWIIQDAPFDASENPGIEGREPEDPYAGSPNEEYSGEYDDGWLVGQDQHKGMNPRPKENEEEDAVEVSSHILWKLLWLLTGYFSSPVGDRQEKSRERSRPRYGFRPGGLFRRCSPRRS